MTATLTDRLSIDQSVELHPLIAGRYSPRAFDETHVISEAELTSLLEAARRAPSAMNRQPWSFIAARRGEAAFEALFSALKPGNQIWAHRASALVAAVVDDGVPGTHGPTDPSRAYDLALAVGQLGLQAGALGLAVHQMGGFEAAEVRRLFSLPDGHHAMVVIAVGTVGDPEELPEALRAREGGPLQRRSLAEITWPYAG